MEDILSGDSGGFGSIEVLAQFAKIKERGLDQLINTFNVASGSAEILLIQADILSVLQCFEGRFKYATSKEVFDGENFLKHSWLNLVRLVHRKGRYKLNIEHLINKIFEENDISLDKFNDTGKRFVGTTDIERKIGKRRDLGKVETLDKLKDIMIATKLPPMVGRNLSRDIDGRPYGDTYLGNKSLPFLINRIEKEITKNTVGNMTQMIENMLDTKRMVILRSKNLGKKYVEPSRDFFLDRRLAQLAYKNNMLEPYSTLSSKMQRYIKMFNKENIFIVQPPNNKLRNIFNNKKIMMEARIEQGKNSVDNDLEEFLKKKIRHI